MRDEILKYKRNTFVFVTVCLGVIHLSLWLYLLIKEKEENATLPQILVISIIYLFLILFITLSFKWPKSLHFVGITIIALYGGL
jgi:hypothetical protein